VNIKEYISSGIIESYVLGMTSAEESEEFENMCATHPEVREARDLFEHQLEQSAIAVGIQPPRKLKSLILSEIEIDAQKTDSRRIISSPEVPPAAPVFKLTPAFWKYVAAASIILLVGSTVLNFYFFNQYSKTNELNAQLLASQNQMASSLKVVQAKLDNYVAALAMNIDTNMVVVKMPGVKEHPGLLATVYWDKRTKNVYLMANNLPEPPSGMQYQLWAIIDGKPLDAGMLNWENGNMRTPLRNILSAQAFAITLEKAGGSLAPTPNAMYVYGDT
jgi:anti-sigma-K factor RskA